MYNSAVIVKISQNYFPVQANLIPKLFFSAEFNFVFLDHYLASAATNGSVVVWDLNRHSHSKQGQYVYYN